MNQITQTEEYLNKAYSDVLHRMIKEEIDRTVEFNSRSALDSQHYREILEDIISDLQKYAATLPSVEQMAEEGLL